MGTGNAYYGFVPPEVHAVPAQATAVPMLRSLSTGELLDRTFALYRSRFWLFAGIGTIPGVVVALSTMARLVYLASTNRSDVLRPNATPDALARVLGTSMLLQVYFLPATILFLISYGVAHAATVRAAAGTTSGVETTIAQAYRAVRARWLRWCGITLLQLWSAAWPSLLPVAVLVSVIAVPSARSNPLLLATVVSVAWLVLMGTLAWGLINYLRNSLAIPAGVQEELGVLAALRRSKALVAGRKGRIFLVLVLTYALQTVAGGLQVPLVWLAEASRGAEHIILQTTELLLSFVLTAVVSPVPSIALYFLYLDERIRREGYDIEWLLQRTLARRMPQAISPVES